MAYDEQLAERIRAHLAAEDDLTEKRMFGGIAFLVGGNMAVAASGQGGLLLRVDPEEAEALTGAAGVSPMQMRGKEVAGWIRVDGSAVDTDEELEPWLTRGVGRARSLSSDRGPAG